MAAAVELCSGPSEAMVRDPSAARMLVPTRHGMFPRARIDKPATPPRRRRAAESLAPLGAAPEPPAEPWLPEGMVMRPSMIERLRGGASLERWGADHKCISLALGPELTAICAHYRTCHNAMRVLAHEELP